jgi:hypothetical protein
MQITIVLDETMVEQAIRPVLDRLDALQQRFEDFISYETESDAQEEYNMGVVTDKATAILEESREQRTVLDSLTVWAQGQKDVLQGVRDDLATAIQNGATMEDLASLDEAIAAFDQNTDIASAVMENTDTEPETPAEPTV